MSLDVHPIVSVDRMFSSDVESIGLNMAEVTDYMRGRGFSDSQILATRVLISSEKNNQDGVTIRGTYDNRTKGITLYPSYLLESSKRAIRESSDPQLCVEHCGKIDARIASGTLVHEIEHLALNSQAQGLRYSRRAGSVALLGCAIDYLRDTARSEFANLLPGSTGKDTTQVARRPLIDKPVKERLINWAKYRWYLVDLEEVLCRKAAKKAPSDLVTFKAKIPDYKSL